MQIKENSNISGTKRLFIKSGISCKRKYLSLSYDIADIMFVSKFDEI